MPTFADSTTQFLDDLDVIIARDGFAVVPVGYGGCSVPGCCAPSARLPWTYTIGLWQAGLPELVLMGLEAVSAQFALNHVGYAAIAGQTIIDERPFELEGVGVKVVDVPDEWLLTDPDRMGLWFGVRSRRDGPIRLPALRQVMWADAQGRFPDDPSGRSSNAHHQPVLRDDPFSQPHVVSRSSRRPGRHHRQAA